MTDYSIGFADPFQDDSPKIIRTPIEELFITSAKKLSYMKFGTKVGPVIADEFDRCHFPEN